MNTRFAVTWLTLQLLHRLLCSVLLMHHYGPDRSFVGCMVVLAVDNDVSTVTTVSSGSSDKTYGSDASMDDILSDSISFDLHVSDRNDELHVNIINEDGFLICDGRISSIQQNGPPINCVHDTKLLKNGENTLFITVFSTRRNSIILQTTRRFNYIKPVLSLVNKKQLVKALQYGVTGLIVAGTSVKLVPILLAVIVKPSDMKPSDVKPSDVKPRPSMKSADAKTIYERRGIDFQVVRNPSKADSRFRRPTTAVSSPISSPSSSSSSASSSLSPTKILQSQPLRYSLALLCLLLVGKGGEASPKSRSYVSTGPSTSSSSSRPTALPRKPRRAHGLLLSSIKINSSTSVSPSSSVVTPRIRLPSTLAAAVKPRSEDLIRKLLTSGVILSVQALFIMMQKIGLVGSAQTVASKLSNYFIPLFK